ncbi:MAG: glycosyltransferase, partial [Nitrososphaerales archaeon]
SCTILEGLSSGRPVISTNVPGGIPDIVNSQVGALIESGDVNQLAFELLKLLSDEDYLRKIGSNARASVEQNYTLDSMIDKLILLYKGTKNRN